MKHCFGNDSNDHKLSSLIHSSTVEFVYLFFICDLGLDNAEHTEMPRPEQGT